MHSPVRPSSRVAIVIPTFNERENILPLLARLHAALRNHSYEIIFVDDDSPDGTAALIRTLAQQDAFVRVLQRIGRRGLSSACIEGMLASSAEFIAVMDADLQHDETRLPLMLETMIAGNLDLVVASRHVGDGSIAGGMTRRRTQLSALGKRLTRALHTDQLSDPMSGFFLIRRASFEQVAHRLSGVGFKILLDIVLSTGGDWKIGEVPFSFRERQHGASKLDVLVGLEYIELLADKMIGSRISVRFLLFCLIGAFGVLLHLLILAVLLQSAHMRFLTGQITAAAIVMVLNYSLNNALSYRDRRRRGLRYWTGLAGFCIACSLGLLANASIAAEAFRHGVWWPLAATIGLLFSAVWNYGVTSVVTWRDNKRHIARIHQRQLTQPAAVEVPRPLPE